MCNYRKCTLLPHQAVIWSPSGLSLGPFEILCVHTPNMLYHQIPWTQISHICKWHQVYLSNDIDEPHNSLAKLNACLSDIWSSMLTNKLKINNDKTELLIIGSPHTHSKLSAVHVLLVGTCTVKPSQCTRNLGVVFDKQVSMVGQVTNIWKSANHHLHNIGAIWEVLTDASAKQLIQSLISSWLDYCNSLLTGLPDVQLKRLQHLQNNAAQIVSKVKHLTTTQVWNNFTGYL